MLALGAVLTVNYCQRRSGRKWLATALIIFAAIWAASMPIVSHLLTLPLEGNYEPLAQWPQGCRTIVVLGGSVVQSPREPLAARLGRASLHRCREAARLYQRFGKPRILASGGPPRGDDQGAAVATAMVEFLKMLGVEPGDILAETSSRTTFENCRQSVRLLKDANVSQIVLVTDAAHMPRAHACFAATGMTATPAACRFQAAAPPPTSRWFIPHAESLIQTQYAIHEWGGRFWYWFTGRI